MSRPHRLPLCMFLLVSDESPVGGKKEEKGLVYVYHMFLGAGSVTTFTSVFKKRPAISAFPRGWFPSQMSSCYVSQLDAWSET